MYKSRMGNSLCVRVLSINENALAYMRLTHTGYVHNCLFTIPFQPFDHSFRILSSLRVKVRGSFCRTLEDICKDWAGRQLLYEIQFECLKVGCRERYPLDLCDNMEMFHHCEGHDFNLNTVRDMFGECC